MKTSTTALAAILVLAGCAGQQSSPANAASAELATASPAPKFVLMTDTGCTSTPGGIAEVNGGTNVWSLRNESASLVNFQLLRVEDDAFDELNAFFRGSPVPEASQPSEGPPFVEEELDRDRRPW